MPASHIASATSRSGGSPVAEAYRARSLRPTSLAATAAQIPLRADLEQVLILIEPMSSYRFMLSVFGRALDDLDDERFIAAWIDTRLAVANKHGLSSGA